jgi:uncharacterized protein YllA (UPF0747 family)
LRFRELQGFPELFADFADGIPAARELFRCAPDAENLRSQAHFAQEQNDARGWLCESLKTQALEFQCPAASLANIDKLRSEGTVVVVATLHAELLGGSMASWLSILTAARLAAWLNEQKIPAVPLCWLDSTALPFDVRTVLLSPDGPVRVELDTTSSLPGLIPFSMVDLFTETARILDIDASVSELLQSLQTAYTPGSDISTAWSRALARLFGSFGIILFRSSAAGDSRGDIAAYFEFEERIGASLAQCEKRVCASGYGTPRGYRRDTQLTRCAIGLLQSAVLPVAAHVISEDDSYDFVCSQALRQDSPWRPALAWPRVSATLLDARSRKIMTRYGLALRELFGGPKAVAHRLMQELAIGENLDRIGRLKADLHERLVELQSLVPKDDRIKVRIEGARRRMLYQIEKAKARLSELRAHRQETLARQLARLCGTIAPLGNRQEKEIAAFQLLLRYSPSLMQTLYEKVNPFLFEHQLISME